MEKLTVLSFREKKRKKIPIVALTCYDAFTARLVNQAGVDLLLVGDSLANTRLGYSSTLPVTLEEMLHHTRAARRGAPDAFLVADMPFGAYEADPRRAAISASRFIKEAGADAVKVEGGRRIAASVQSILDANIPVMGHVGLTPQSVRREGGYRVHGRSARESADILADARKLESLGVFSIVIEGVPAPLGARLTRALKIPTIGIGAGPSCDGQILVFDDLVGLTEGKLPNFVKPFAKLRPILEKALDAYTKEVRARRFPTERQSYR